MSGGNGIGCQSTDNRQPRFFAGFSCPIEIALAISSVSVSVSGGVTVTFRFARCNVTRGVEVSDLYWNLLQL